MLITAVVPCYNEEEALPLFYEEFKKVGASMHEAHPELSFELLLIDDGSKDKTLPIMRKLAADAPAAGFPFEVRYISFSRNFGKEAGLFAGLSNASGELVATMDADTQDPPSLLPEMYERILAGDCDQVATRRADRSGEPPIRSWFAHRFYHLINRMSQADIVDGARDFRLMKRCVVDAIVSMGEYNRFSKGIFGWVGFKTEWISYENVERAAGQSKWSFWSLFKYAIEGIVAFSTAPLQVASFAGVIFCILAIVAFVFIIVRALLFGDPVAGWPSMVSIILFIGGMQMLCLGVIGQYLAKTYLETKHRPIYLVGETNIEGLGSRK